MRELASRKEVTSPHGKSSVAILIFQDFASIPLMLALGLFAGNAAPLAPMALWIVLKAILVLTGTAVLGRWVVPPLMDRVARTRSQELFHITAITLCLAIPGLLAKMGLPVALGAFLAGLILADSDYAHSTLGSLLPIRDIFASLFFISIGMLLDFRMIASEGILVLLAALGILTLKAALGTLTALILSKPLRTAILIGTAISPAGEFGLLLIQASSGLGLFEQRTYQVLLGVTILTMALTPAVFALGRRLAYGASAKKGPSWVAYDQEEEGALLIVGFGIVGQGVALAARYAKIPYRVIELNPLTIRKEKQKSTPILFGDATNPEVLSRAGIHSASALVITVHADPLATRRIVEVAKHLNPSLSILARVSFLSEDRVLRSMGADEIVIEEMETAIALFGKVLIYLGLKEKELTPLIERLRKDDYNVLRLK
jgi:CPA2 family monovalent cation:H+ antiporter-2